MSDAEAQAVASAMEAVRLAHPLASREALEARVFIAAADALIAFRLAAQDESRRKAVVSNGMMRNRLGYEEVDHDR